MAKLPSPIQAGGGRQPQRSFGEQMLLALASQAPDLALGLLSQRRLSGQADLQQQQFELTQQQGVDAAQGAARAGAANLLTALNNPLTSEAAQNLVDVLPPQMLGGATIGRTPISVPAGAFDDTAARGPLLAGRIGALPPGEIASFLDTGLAGIQTAAQTELARRSDFREQDNFEFESSLRGLKKTDAHLSVLKSVIDMNRAQFAQEHIDPAQLAALEQQFEMNRRSIRRESLTAAINMQDGARQQAQGLARGAGLTPGDGAFESAVRSWEIALMGGNSNALELATSLDEFLQDADGIPEGAIADRLNPNPALFVGVQAGFSAEEMMSELETATQIESDGAEFPELVMWSRQLMHARAELIGATPERRAELVNELAGAKAFWEAHAIHKGRDTKLAIPTKGRDGLPLTAQEIAVLRQGPFRFYERALSDGVSLDEVYANTSSPTPFIFGSSPAGVSGSIPRAAPNASRSAEFAGELMSTMNEEFGDVPLLAALNAIAEGSNGRTLTGNAKAAFQFYMSAVGGATAALLPEGAVIGSDPQTEAAINAVLARREALLNRLRGN